MSETTTYTVTGMTCGHCAASVTEEISELAGVEDVAVGPGDPEAERDAAAGGQLGPLEVEAVAAVGDHEAARDVVGGRHGLVTAGLTVACLALVGGGRSLDRTGDPTRTPGDRERGDQGGDERGDAQRRTHAIAHARA